ncbi:hypothetical protein [Rudanella lutea]|jgi:hypothetical protein|uniref:hypothetical protein n=1 Tax=Rudanella lutea TaxID=451374 RepID=UPI00036713FF|nr:hypothetical protein [Rudanella lutea]
MSTTDLKTLLHNQIDLVEKEEDLQDLLLTVSEFIQFRVQNQQESPELLAHLKQALTAVTNGHSTPHDQVITESKQWITR